MSCRYDGPSTSAQSPVQLPLHPLPSSTPSASTPTPQLQPRQPSPPHCLRALPFSLTRFRLFLACSIPPPYPSHHVHRLPSVHLPPSHRHPLHLLCQFHQHQCGGSQWPLAGRHVQRPAGPLYELVLPRLHLPQPSVPHRRPRHPRLRRLGQPLRAHVDGQDPAGGGTGLPCADL